MKALLVAAAVAHSGLALNDVQMKGSHNSYRAAESLTTQLETFGIRALELDIHAKHDPLGRPAPGDWYVYHWWPFDMRTSCATLSQCFAEIRAFHEARPGHEILSLWIDLKEGWSAGHRPADFDELIVREFGRDAVFGEADLAERCPGPTLQASVTGDCGWPTLEDLRGRILFVFTGDEQAMAEYRAASARRLAFSAPILSRVEDLEMHSDVVIFNLDERHAALGVDVSRAGFISRQYGPNDPAAWNDAVASRIHQIATDHLDDVASPWAKTRNRNGWPFRCLDEQVVCEEMPGEL